MQFRVGTCEHFYHPIADGVFVLEELVRRFDTRIAIATFGASAGAIAVARLFLGYAPDFHVEALPYPKLWHGTSSLNRGYPCFALRALASSVLSHIEPSPQL
jgi:H+/Cl- antiporter ClcA